MSTATTNYRGFPFRLLYVITGADGTHTGYEVPHRSAANARAYGAALLAQHPEIPTMYIAEVDKDGQAVSYEFEFLAGGEIKSNG